MSYEQISYILYIATGIIALLFALLTYLFRKKIKILVGKTFTDGFFALNYLFQGSLAISGVFQHTISIFRDLASIENEKNNKAFSRQVWKYIICASYVIIPIFTWSEVGWICLLPMVGSMISTFSLFSKNTTITKILTIPAQSFCLAYSIIIQNYFGSTAYAIMIISAIIGLINDKINKKINSYFL